MADIKADLTNAVTGAGKKDINEDVSNIINTLTSCLNSLGEKSSKYVTYYDNYIKNTLLDASLIKEEMKKAVIEVFNDEL